MRIRNILFNLRQVKNRCAISNTSEKFVTRQICRFFLINQSPIFLSIYSFILFFFGGVDVRIRNILFNLRQVKNRCAISNTSEKFVTRQICHAQVLSLENLLAYMIVRLSLLRKTILIPEY